MKQIYGGLTEVVDHKNIGAPNNAALISNVIILSPIGDGFIPNQTVYIENGINVSIDTLNTLTKDVNNLNIRRIGVLNRNVGVYLNLGKPSS